MNTIFFEPVREKVKPPTYGTGGSAGIDFYIPECWLEEDIDRVKVEPFSDILIPSGFKCKIPEGTMLTAFNKSGIALQGLITGACVIDEDYEGEFKIHLINPTDKPVYINPNKKIAQFILLKYERPEIITGPIQGRILYTGNRKDNGFGSTH